MQIKRQRRGAHAWAQVLARFADSGLSAAAFCRREAISVASFYQWRARLAVQPEHPMPLRSDAPTPTGFLDLGTLQAGEPLPAGFDLRLDLGGGLTLQLRRG